MRVFFVFTYNTCRKPWILKNIEYWKELSVILKKIYYKLIKYLTKPKTNKQIVFEFLSIKHLVNFGSPAYRRKSPKQKGNKINFYLLTKFHIDPTARSLKFQVPILWSKQNSYVHFPLKKQISTCQTVKTLLGEFP